MWIIIYCKQGRYFPCHPRWYLNDFPPSTHISTWYVLKFNECFCEFWYFWELLPKEPCCPVYKLAPPSLTSQNLHFYAPSMQPFEVLQAFLCCIPLSWVWFPGNSLRCRFLCQYLLRNCLQEKPEMEQGRHNRTGQDVGSPDPMGSFWSMNYTIKLSYPEVRGLAISVYYWYCATFGKGSNLGISRQVLSHRLRTILRRMQLGALNNPSSEQLGDLLQSSQVFAYTIHSMKKQQPLLLCYCLKTCPNIVVFKPYLGNLPIHSYPHHPSPSWISTLFPSLTLYALIILFGIILGRVFALPRLSKESLFKEKLWMSLP